jgi:hypothetical protein
MADIRPGMGRPTQLGVGWFVSFGLGHGLPENDGDVPGFLDSIIESAAAALSTSELSRSMELPKAEEALNRLVEHALRDPYRAEHWVAAALVSALRAQQALQDGDANKVAFHTLQLSHARAMRYFYENLNDLVWQGYQAYGLRELREALGIWRANEDNGDERFWQEIFFKHPFLLTQLVTGPAVVVGEKLYVGGKGLDNKGGNLADFLISNQLSGSIALLELKTPCTDLLRKTQYRDNIYVPSVDLGGAVNQVLSYRRSLLDDWRKLLDSTPNANAIHPKCYVIAGRYSEVGTEVGRRESFELYRNALHDVEVITFDELFASAEGLIAVLEHGRASELLSIAADVAARGGAVT